MKRPWYQDARLWFFLAGVILLAAVVNEACGDITVQPSKPGMHTVVAQSPTPGRWMVVRAAPFGFVQSRQYLIEGGSLCVFETTAGVYGVVLIPTDTTKQLETAEVKLTGGGDDGDDGDDDTKPPPGKRTVVIVRESENDTPAQALVHQKIQEYCKEKGHVYRLVDDDTVDTGGQQPAWLREYLDLITKQGVTEPAMIVVADWNGKRYATAKALPKDATAAVKVIQELGG